MFYIQALFVLKLTYSISLFLGIDHAENLVYDKLKSVDQRFHVFTDQYPELPVNINLNEKLLADDKILNIALLIITK